MSSVGRSLNQNAATVEVNIVLHAGNVKYSKRGRNTATENSQKDFIRRGSQYG